MMRCYAARLCPLLGVFAVFCVRPALAEDACAPMAIDADGPVRARWPGLLNRVREAFDARDDIDTCAQITLRMSDASVVVDVVLPDGRFASRPVARREDVVPTIEALLLVPQRQAQPETRSLEPSRAAAPPVPASAAARGGTIAPPSSRAVSVRDRPALVDHEARARTAEDPSSHFRIELSVISGVRIGDGQTGAGLGALSFVDLGGWLVGFEGRADRYRTIAVPSDGPALELAVLGGRRFRFGSMALDLTAGPAAVLQGTTTFQTPTSAESNSSNSPRLVCGVRLNFGARSWLRAFTGIDGELGPTRASDPLVPREHSLPLWTLGLALGATVGTQ